LKKRPVIPGQRRRSLINLIGALLLVCAAVLIVLLFFVHSPELQRWYGVYQARLSTLETMVLELRNVWLIMAVVMLLYAIKSFVSLFPVSMLCVITAAVLPVPLSFAVHVLGITLLVSLKYLWGFHRGGGQFQRLLSINNDIRIFLERDGKGNPWLLFVFRVLPSFPINTISQIYGAMGFDYVDFVLISLLGFLPKLVSYIILGSHAFNPLSIPFLIPLIILFTLSGVSLIGVNSIVSSVMRQKSSELTQEQEQRKDFVK
jgi:uncharacterized membrane protein YdjX (TVP38/TMEM64 family)